MKQLTYIVGLYLVSSPAFAGATETVDAWAGLVVSACYLIGIITFIYGIMGFKRNAQNPQQYPLASCFSSVVTGSLLLSMPLVYGILKRSSVDPKWTDSRDSLALAPHMKDIGKLKSTFIGRFMPPETAEAIFGFIYFIGLLSFSKGIIKLKNVGTIQGGHGALGSAFMHIIGGVVVMNISKVTCIVAESISMPALCIA